jgi:hypothetical protein
MRLVRVIHTVARGGEHVPETKEKTEKIEIG